jgi:Protein of unknown function (DUF2975)
MKKIMQLKQLLDFVIVFSAIIIGLVIVTSIFGLATNNLSNWKFSVQGNRIDKVTISNVILIIASSIGYAFFIFAILKLKKLVGLFVDKQYFTKESILLLKSIGNYFLISTVTVNVSIFCYNAFANSNINLNFGILSPDSIVFSIIISLFFIILSYIFNEAKILKDENELTI